MPKNKQATHSDNRGVEPNLDIREFLKEEISHGKKIHQALKNLFEQFAERGLQDDPEISEFSPEEREELKKELIQAFENAYVLTHVKMKKRRHAQTTPNLERKKAKLTP